MAGVAFKIGEKDQKARSRERMASPQAVGCNMCVSPFASGFLSPSLGELWGSPSLHPLYVTVGAASRLIPSSMHSSSSDRVSAVGSCINRRTIGSTHAVSSSVLTLSSAHVDRTIDSWIIILCCMCACVLQRCS